jgi:glycine/D-amino acid oxidase-like deaminating enzyme
MIGSESYCGALLIMGNGHLHPLNLCLGEARAAVSLGVKLYEQSAVESIGNGDTASVVTRAVNAKFVVLPAMYST